jgi:hypothetical protein
MRRLARRIDPAGMPMSKLKPCSIRGVAYPSRAAAAAALGLTRQRIHQLAAQPDGGRKVRTDARPVTIDGVSYGSTAEAAGALGVSYWVARYLAKSGTVPQGSRKPALAARNAAPDYPPTRNAIKLLRRMAVALESSVWIRRLPEPRRCEIGRARHILQEQADLLLKESARWRRS